MDSRLASTIQIQQQVIHEAVERFVEVIAEFCRRSENLFGDAMLANDVVRAVGIREETPACKLKELVDFDPGLGFFARGCRVITQLEFSAILPVGRARHIRLLCL